ncbi:unnamed protein product, partial [marine sediment metagenome]
FINFPGFFPIEINISRLTGIGDIVIGMKNYY